MTRKFTRNNIIIRYIFQIKVVSVIIFFLILFNSYVIYGNNDINSNIDNLFKNRMFSAAVLKIKSSETNFQNISDNNLYNYYLGVCYYYLNDYENSLFYLNKVTDPYFKRYFDPVNFYIATIYFNKKSFKTAFKYYFTLENNKELISNIYKYYYNYAVSALNDKNYRKAIDLLLEGINYLKYNFNNKNINKNTYNFYIPFYYYSLARIYKLDNKYESALKYFQILINDFKKFEFTDDSLFYTGEIYYYQKEYLKAKTTFLYLIEKYKNSNFYFDSLFYLAKITGNKQYYKLIIEQNPDYRNIDWVYYNYALLIEKKEYFEKVLQITKNPDLIYNSIVSIINLLKENYESINIKNDKSNDIGTGKDKNVDTDKNIETTKNKNIDKNKNEIVDNNKDKNIEMNKDTNIDKDTDNNKNINSNKDINNDKIHYLLNLIKNNILKASNKVELLNYALNLIYSNLIYSKEKNEDNLSFDDDLSFFENLNNKISFSDKQYYIFGKIYFKKEKFEKAIYYFKKALNVSKNEKYYYFLGISYFNDNQYDLALINLNKVIDFKKDKDKYKNYTYRILSQNYIGIIYIFKGQYSKALNIFNDLIKISPAYLNKKEINYYRLICFYNLKQYKNSSKLIRELIKDLKLKDQLDYTILKYSIKILPNIDINYADALYSIYGEKIDNNFDIAFYLSEKYFSKKMYNKSLYYLDYIFAHGSANQKIDALIKKYLLFYNIEKYNKANEVINVSYEYLTKNHLNYKKDLILRYLIESNIKLKNIKNSELYYNILKNNNILKNSSDTNNQSIAAKSLYQYFNKIKNYEKALYYLNDVIELIFNKNEPDLDKLHELYFQKVLILYELKEYRNALNLIKKVLDYQKEKNKTGDISREDYVKIITLKNIQFNILLHLKDIKNIKSFIFEQIQKEENQDNLYYDVVNLILLYQIKIFNKNDLYKVKEILSQKDGFKFIKTLLDMVYNFNSNTTLKQMNKNYSQFIKDDNEKISFWARILYAIYFYENKNYSSSKKVLEALLKYDFKYENQLILYYLIKIEEKNGIKNDGVYFKMFNSDYKDSLIYLLIK